MEKQFYRVNSCMNTTRFSEEAAIQDGILLAKLWNKSHPERLISLDKPRLEIGETRPLENHGEIVHYAVWFQTLAETVNA